MTAWEGVSAAPVADLKSWSCLDVAEFAPDALVVIVEAGAIMYLNAAAEMLFGYRREWLLGRHYGTLLPERFQRHLEEIRGGSFGGDPDLFGLRRDGTEFPMEVNVAPLSSPGYSGVVASIRDVSERRRSDTALREALSLVSATLESTADGILVVTAEGRIAGANERFVAMWGIPADLLASGDDGKVMACVLDQLTDPDAFVAKVKALYADPSAESLDRLDFVDGRIFERYSRPQRVGDTVVGRVWSFRDVTARIRAEEQANNALCDLSRQAAELKLLAFRDPLTGLANRVLFRDRLEQALAAGDRAGIHVLLLDLDDFKEINDVLGHQAGDELLVEAGHRLRRCLGPADTVARLGGDEFVILLTATPDPDAVAARVLGVMNAPFALHGHELHPGVSVGVTGTKGLDHIPDLMRRADIAMYAAKAAGKNRYLHFDPEMMMTLLARNDLEAGLRAAVQDGGISVHYQPVLSAASATVTGVEALARWESPGRNIPPAEFIPAAESTGLINVLGQQILTRACTDMRAWLTEDPERSIAVNVSAMQLRGPGYARTVLETLTAAGVRADQLILEVTESIFLDAVPHITTQLGLLRDEGIRVAIDDFGTGYSSLGRLQDLPVDILKIDRSFVSVIITGAETLPILASMTAMAHHLGLKMTAEGVETTAQALHLMRLGCDCLQGYFFSEPVPVGSLPAAEEQATARIRELKPGTPGRGDGLRRRKGHW
ncbi:EAL domain-containing protein [Pseudarthrobacter sp. NPDC080039]|uniref:putative bifunctional diguanylate cyclase/phosphodiesterase n=1 Tax=unclassified Pseudarthrobacter TaxID=2647000 RepID=UPI00344E40A3